MSFPNWKVPNENSDTMSIINTLFGTNNIAITDWIESLKIEITDNGINKFVNNAFFTIDKEESVTWLNTLKK